MDNLTDFQKEYLDMLREEEGQELKDNADAIYSFKKLVARKGISLTDEDFKFYRTTGIVAIYPNLISHLHDSLVPDKEGLLDFKKLCDSFSKKPFINGYLFSDKYVLMAHPYFRRGFQDINNYAPRFVDLFWTLSNPYVDSYISLDADRVRINVDESSYMEKDTWFGAQFNRDISSIGDGNVKLRPPMDIESHLISFFFSSVYALDIKWETKNNIKSFQCEEFKTDEIKLAKNGMDYFPARYLHAEYDLNSGYFRHFDGAIHFYTETEYFSRRDSDFNYNFKNDNQIKTFSQKLFKMNGIVDIDTWIEFSSHFLVGNPLVLEYFEGKYPQGIHEMLEIVRKKSNDSNPA